jgi:hypothetical protein
MLMVPVAITNLAHKSPPAGILFEGMALRNELPMHNTEVTDRGRELPRRHKRRSNVHKVVWYKGGMFTWTGSIARRETILGRQLATWNCTIPKRV